MESSFSETKPKRQKTPDNTPHALKDSFLGEEKNDEFDFTKEDSILFAVSNTADTFDVTNEDLSLFENTTDSDEFDFTNDSNIYEDPNEMELSELIEKLFRDINRIKFNDITPSKEKLRPKEFKKRFLPLAIYVKEKYGVPVSLTLAQCALETKWGSSKMMNEYFNAFGIKIHKSKRKKPYLKYQQFTSVFDSFDEYGQILSNKKFQSLFSQRKTLFPDDNFDYERYVHAVVKGGYAESKTYAEHLIDIISHNWPNIDKELEEKKEQ